MFSYHWICSVFVFRAFSLPVSWWLFYLFIYLFVCFFHRTTRNNFTICMEIQKTLNSQSNLEKEEWNWRNLPAWLQTLLQSHSHQDGIVLAQRQKYRSVEQNRKPRDKSMYLGTPYLRQRRQGYAMEKKTTSLTSGAGKTGQPPVKEWN